nr:hypothetical protein [Tanacetum cinerariifolium]GEY85895.1 hypothetical protein [Tanacetum cinerariifolium]
WRTASVRTLNNEEIELNATVDGHDKTINEASVMRHLKLVDADGISTLPTTKFFKQLALLGKTMIRIGRMDIRIPQSNVPSSVINEVITKEMHDGLGREDNTSRSGEDSMQLLELMAICTKLSNKVTTLKNELTSTKAVYNKALITLTKRVKKLEKKLKHKRMRMTTWSKVVSKGRHMRQLSIEWILVLLVLKQMMMKLLVKSNDDETLAETLLNIKRSAAKDKGKAIMQESESPKKIKKKEMMKISLDEEIAQRFYEEEKAQILRDEEYAQQVLAQWITDEARLAQENLA